MDFSKDEANDQKKIKKKANVEDLATLFEVTSDFIKITYSAKNIIVITHAKAC